jgi:hypothetical protein
MDKDRLSKDDFLGQVSVPLNQTIKDQWFELCDAKGQSAGGSRGQLQLSVQRAQTKKSKNLSALAELPRYLESALPGLLTAHAVELG